MTSDQLLRQLISRISPPEKPDSVAGTLLSDRLGPGLSLPDDYRLFLDVYGPGWFTEDGYPVLWLFDLVSDSNQFMAVGASEQHPVDMLLTTATELHELYPDVYPAAYPKVPGLLPWGTFDQGCAFYWWVNGPPNRWSIVADSRGRIYRYKYSMLEFLVVNMTSVPGDKFFDDGEERFSGFMPASQYWEWKRTFFKGGEA